MDMLQSLLGGGQQRSEYEDFVNRYDRGAPYEGISDQEAYDRYQRVAPHLPPQEYELSAEEAFARMSPQERMEFAQLVSQRARQQGYDFIDRNRDGIDDRMQQDPRYLAQMSSRLEQQQPGLLAQLLGGGGGMGGGGMGAGSALNNPLAKAALAGIAAMAVKRMMGGGGMGGNAGPLGGGRIRM